MQAWPTLNSCKKKLYVFRVCNLKYLQKEFGLMLAIVAILFKLILSLKFATQAKQQTKNQTIVKKNNELTFTHKTNHYQTKTT